MITFTKTLLLIITLFFFLTTSAQTKKRVEELALYHLDSLTKVDPAFKDFKYFTNGFIEKQKTVSEDTMSVMKVKPDLHLKSAFNNLTIVEDTTSKSLSLPRRLRKNGGYQPLTIFRFLKIGHEYFVFFKIEYEYGGQNALIVMDEKGTLLRRGIGNYIY